VHLIFPRPLAAAPGWHIQLHAGGFTRSLA